jgi:hypothetical protein
MSKPSGDAAKRLADALTESRRIAREFDKQDSDEDEQREARLVAQLAASHPVGR